MGAQGVPKPVWSHRRATLAQIAERINADYDDRHGADL